MIDIKHAKQVFINYANNYDLSNGKIKLKYDHILRVANLSKIIAENLNLSIEDINLAYLIGLFHDIGRFEQVRRFNTFSDSASNTDHAKLSVEILEENNFIREFILDNKYDEIIKKAVFNHNKLTIEANINERELLFSKIIRDADKIDIINISTFFDLNDVFWEKDFSIKQINSSILENFKTGKLVKYEDVKNNADQILCFFAYIYDINFPFSKIYLKEQKYFEKFVERCKNTFNSTILNTQLDEILEITNNYLSNN